MSMTTLAFYDYRSALLAFSILTLFSFSTHAQPTDWEVQIDKNGIKIFSRWRDNHGEDKVREIKANFTVSAKPQKLIGLLQNVEKALDWMAGAKSFSLLTATAPKGWYAYTEFGLPWPFQNQDLVAFYQVEQVDSKTAKVKIVAHPNYRPEKPKIERMQHFEACWTFQALSSGDTEVSYTAFTYRKPSAPRWIIDPVVQNSLWKTMSGFKELVEK